MNIEELEEEIKNLNNRVNSMRFSIEEAIRMINRLREENIELRRKVEANKPYDSSPIPDTLPHFPIPMIPPVIPEYPFDFKRMDTITCRTNPKQ